MRRMFTVLAACGMLALAAAAQAWPGLTAFTKQYVSVAAPVVALEHVRVIDGTGAPERADQTIILERGKITAVGPAASTAAPAGAKLLDLRGDTVIPGLVGMHDHLFYPSELAQERQEGPVLLYHEMGYSFPRLYLACGVTTLRTTGSISPYTDLNLKRLIDSGQTPGPEMFITSPYLEGKGSFTPNLHELTGPADATRTVNYWAAEGVTSYKAYMHITRAELKAAIVAAHAHGLTITGHLCAVGFTEAAALGIDNLEHGLMVDTEFDPGKKPDVCPSQAATERTLAKMNVEGPRIQGLIHDLVRHHVAVTSTLPVFEEDAPGRPPLEPRVLAAMSPAARVSYLTIRAMVGERKGSLWPVLLKDEMEFEHDFVKAGGLLMAGEDPTGYGGVLAGFGDQRELELLVEAGFTPLEAIHIATVNGAKFLHIEDRAGTIAAGKEADLVVIKGDPGKKIDDIEKVQTVFKDGVGYDSARLIGSVNGAVGLH